ncbi:MAG TPA: hypothetical protein VEK31_07710 [Xanthobacteraceae bacterium]|nr:hypothetical protein [Xanthobacteraceae bacterium]
MRIVFGASIFAGLVAFAAQSERLVALCAQALNKLPPAAAPCSVLSGQPCHPWFCGVFHRGSCFPQYLPPIGQDLRLTIVSADDPAPAAKDAGESNKPNGGANNASENKASSETDNAAEEKPIDSSRAVFAALRACWIPPPEETHGREWNIRSALGSNATAKSSLRRVSLIQVTMRRLKCATSIAMP